MSSYADYDTYDKPRRQRSHRSRRDRDPDRAETVYAEQIRETRRGGPGVGGGAPRGTSQELVRVKRRDDSYDEVEDVERDFPPGGGGYVRDTTRVQRGAPPRARSAGRDGGYRSDTRRRRMYLLFSKEGLSVDRYRRSSERISS